MTKLFKNSKQILAFVFAFAVIAVSLFTGNAAADITAEAACDVSKIDYWDGTKASSFAGGTGTESDPYIIKTAEQLAFCCFGQDATTSKGKYYKVDDSIDIFVMQPQNVVDLEVLMGLESAQATKDYLSGLSGKKNWMDAYAWKGFNGNFDGNGVTIYGIYADGIAKNSQDVGLFPRYDGGYADGSGNVVANVCKNLAVKNSYFSSTRRLGVISGASYGLDYDGNINGIIHYDTIAVVNCYITANASNINHFGEEGIIADGGAGDVSTFNNCLVMGNYAYNTAVNKNMPLLAATNPEYITDSNGNKVTSKISNSIILGSDPFARDHYNNAVMLSKKENGETIRIFFDNVITDKEAGAVTITNPAGWGTAVTKVTFSEDQVKQITASGFDFVAQADKLDWKNIWFMSENGPELRAFHGNFKETITATTHVWECEDCGLKSFGGEANHTWVTEDEQAYKCSVCDYNCKHDSLHTYDSLGDCVVDPGTYTECNYCDYVGKFKTGDAPGHDFTHVEADPGHCEADGHAEYWECSVCNKMFATDDKMAPMDTAVTLDDLNTGLGTHLKKTDENGVVVEYNENGHWYICAIDGGRIDFNCGVLADDQVVKHDFENAKCTECGYECVDHQFKDTGKIAVIGDCFTDEEKEIKCTLCGYKTTVVTVEAGHDIVKVEAVAPTDKMEGTKEHYKCETCHSVYADAEGKTSVTTASLVVRKTLPKGYDQGTMSPATRDNVVAVMAVAALAGAAFVIARKVKAD